METPLSLFRAVTLGVSMWFVYFDESKENNSFCVYSALIVDTAHWNDAFGAVKELRRQLKRDYGIYIGKELHAWKFAAGKGRISDRVINKRDRAIIFRNILRFIATSGYFRIISSVNTNEFYAFDRIMNRINRAAEADEKHALMIFDEGQEAQFTKRIRRMRVHNHIPSRLGAWGDGEATRNITVDRIIEDPVFKQSHNSYFIQLVDFCAYALLRMERPIASRSSLGYDDMYEELRPAVNLLANRRDHRNLGIIR